MNKLSLGFAIASALGLALVQSCLERQDDEPTRADETRCASCHGDPRAPGDFLQKAAPPRDLMGDVDPAYPGVGAHSIHVYASETHAAIACSECHLVPNDTRSPGHADTAVPAELTFGALAKTGDRFPTYDTTTRRCSDSYCHREAKAVWTQPRNSQGACGSCHGLPPPAPHVQSARCDACHAAVVDSQQRIIAPNLHVDGQIQFTTGDCTSCHGSGDDPAPPKDTLGNELVSALGVGAHQAHLLGGANSRALSCSECHVVPESAEATGHADPLPAEVAFTGVALGQGHVPSWNRDSASCADSFCHAPSPLSTAPLPIWTQPGPLPCNGCHATPPPAPHPQLDDCSRCHGEVVAEDDVSMLDRTRHVDGVVDVAFNPSCTSCHGGANPAPPVDVAGHTATTFPGVGAHQSHVLGSVRARAVPCVECHQVPTTVLEQGHLDSALPAEIVFSGASIAFGGTPSYAAGACQNTSCHGGIFPKGHLSGGSNTAPIWTQVDGTEAACGSCHGLPPPAPHPVGSLNPVCNACHQNIAPDNSTFLFPELHVDGTVTFTLP
jgi:predicted CxxxxCH...CXXCH cytochrome family protein